MRGEEIALQGGRQLPSAPTALAGDLPACLSREEDACALSGGLGQAEVSGPAPIGDR